MEILQSRFTKAGDESLLFASITSTPIDIWFEFGDGISSLYDLTETGFAHKIDNVVVDFVEFNKSNTGKLLIYLQVLGKDIMSDTFLRECRIYGKVGVIEYLLGVATVWETENTNNLLSENTAIGILIELDTDADVGLQDLSRLHLRHLVEVDTQDSGIFVLGDTLVVGEVPPEVLVSLSSSTIELRRFNEFTQVIEVSGVATGPILVEGLPSFVTYSQVGDTLTFKYTETDFIDYQSVFSITRQGFKVSAFLIVLFHPDELTLSINPTEIIMTNDNRTGINVSVGGTAKGLITVSGVSVGTSVNINQETGVITFSRGNDNHTFDGYITIEREGISTLLHMEINTSFTVVTTVSPASGTMTRSNMSGLSTTVGGDSTGTITVTGLPSGVSYSVAGNVVTFSAAPGNSAMDRPATSVTIKRGGASATYTLTVNIAAHVPVTRVEYMLGNTSVAGNLGVASINAVNQPNSGSIAVSYSLQRQVTVDYVVTVPWYIYSSASIGVGSVSPANGSGLTASGGGSSVTISWGNWPSANGNNGGSVSIVFTGTVPADSWSGSVSGRTVSLSR